MSAGFFSSITAIGRPLMKTTISGRRSCLLPCTVNWLTTRNWFFSTIVKVDQLHMVGFGLVAVAVFDRHPFEEQLVEGAVVVDQHRGFGLGDGLCGFFEGGEGDVRVDLLQGGEQAAGQHYLLIVAALRRIAIMGDVGAVGVDVAAGAEPVEAELFELVFGDHLFTRQQKVDNYTHNAYSFFQGLGIPGRQLASADSSGPFVIQGKHFSPQPLICPCPFR